MLTAFPDLHLTVEHWAIEDDMITAQATFTGTHPGAEFMGVPPTGNTVTLSNIDIWHVKDGRVLEVLAQLRERRTSCCRSAILSSLRRNEPIGRWRGFILTRAPPANILLFSQEEG